MIKYYIIHCKEHTQRLPIIEKAKQMLGQPIEVFDGYYTNGVSLENQLEYIQSIDSSIQFIREFRFKLPSEIGCYLSHHKLIAQIKDSGTEGYSVIFEDDIKIENNTHSLIENIIKQNVDFDIINMGNTFNTPPGARVKANIYNIDKRRSYCGTWALLINNKNIEKLYQVNCNITSQIDMNHVEHCRQDNLQYLIVNPRFCELHWNIKSTIR
jgi:GR25 family glycosyltransferase involved in LPS biosynthesis